MVIFQLAMLVYWRAYLPWIFARQHPPFDMWQDGVEGKHLFMIPSDEGFREDFRYRILINIFLPGPSKGCQMGPKGCQLTIP